MYVDGRPVAQIYEETHTGHEQLYKVLRKTGVNQRLLNRNLPKNNQMNNNKPFGTRVIMSSEDVELFGEFNGGLVIKRTVVRQASPVAKALFEYNVRYGQGNNTDLVAPVLREKVN